MKSAAALDSERDGSGLDASEEPDVPPPVDTDHDGILDANDQCPTEAEDRDGFEDDDGCPELDNDRDRVLDVNDKCPNEPETYNGLADDDGCPDVGAGYRRPPRPPLPQIKQGPIAFDEGSAVVRGDSAAILDSMVAYIKVAPGFQGVIVAGHAAAYERRPAELAGARVEAVRRYLVKRGVPPPRIRAEPFGAKSICDRGAYGESAATTRRVDVCISIGL